MVNDLKFDFSLFDAIPDICFLVSEDFKIIDVNKAAGEKIGYNNGKLINSDFLKLVEDPYIDKTKAALTNCLNSSKSENLFIKLCCSGQHLIDAYITATLYRPNQKNIFIFVKDVTEEKNKELNLRRFYSIANNTVNPVQITDINGKMVYVNSAFVNASGYSEEELIGKNPNIFSSGKQSKKFWKKMWTTINAGKVWVGEIENRKKNGEPFYTQVLISPFLDSDGNVAGFFGIHRDLHDKKMMEKQLIHTQKMESIGILAAGVAHEVGNPLASISALVQVVQRSSEDEFAKEKLELVKGQINRISKTIRDLVDFSRPSNYELNLTDLNKNIYNAVEIIRAGTKIKDIKFNLNLNKDIPLIPLIEDQIQQVFVNILINAVDAISELTDNNPEKKISVSSDKDEDDIIIIFEDSGKGIDEKNLTKIFEPFFTTKKEGKGTGLGLWITYGIITSFQGTIDVESSIGKGTKFIITLPVMSWHNQ
ncbi:MAG: PAS domain S-box protein [Ignavibacteriaceae bacterium]